jgi:hypothetical protein
MTGLPAAQTTAALPGVLTTMASNVSMSRILRTGTTGGLTISGLPSTLNQRTPSA